MTDHPQATVRWLRASYIAGAVADGLVGILMLLPDRKGVLVLTIFPVITGLIATMVWAAASGFFSVGRVFPYVVLCAALIGLMGFSYLKAARS